MRVSRERSRSGLALALILGLAGCGTSGIQVQRETHLPPDSAGASFMMLAARGQDRDPGYLRDAELVAAQLEARHFVRVMDPAQARFAVMVWDRRAEGAADPTPRPVSGRPVGRGGGRGGGGMSRSQSSSPPEFVADERVRPSRHVEIQIYDFTRPQGAGQHVFTADARITEAEAHGTGATELITAALRDFPGQGRQEFAVPVTR